MDKAVWKKGRKKIAGYWRYSRFLNRFVIHIDGKDPVTGVTRQPFEVSGDEPEFCGWKLVEEKPKKSKK